MNSKKTTKQVPNPTGKGGFGENPQNRSNGGWKKEDSIGYCMNLFLRMSQDEFQKYPSSNPNMTMAQTIAYSRVGNSIKKLEEAREVANRTEGLPKQPVDLTTQGDKITGIDVNIVDATTNQSDKRSEKESGK